MKIIDKVKKLSKDILDIKKKFGWDDGIKIGKDGDISINYRELFKSLNKEEEALFNGVVGVMDYSYEKNIKENPEIDNTELEQRIASEINRSLVYTKVVMPNVEKYKSYYDVFLEMSDKKKLGLNSIISEKFKDLFKLDLMILRTYVK